MEAEGTWNFSVRQTLYTDGYFCIDSKYEHEHSGQVLDMTTYPAKGTPDYAEREHEWIRAHAQPLSAQR